MTVYDSRGREIKFAERRPVLEGEVGWANPRQITSGQDTSHAPVLNHDRNVRTRGIDVYDSMTLDDQVKAALSLKKLAVVSSGWEVVSPEDEDEDYPAIEVVREQLERVRVENVVVNVMTALDFGYSVSELVWDVSGRSVALAAVKTRHPRDIEFAVDVHGNVKHVVQTTGDKIRADIPLEKVVLWVNDQRFDNPYGRPDLAGAFRPWKVKDDLQKWFPTYLERFGSPPLFALFNNTAFTEGQVSALKTVLKSLQNSTSGVIGRRDPGDLELWTPKGVTEHSQVFKVALDYYDMCIARALLMPGLIGATGDQTEGSLARSQVHYDVFMLVVENLRKQMAVDVVQRQIVERIVALNFPSGTKAPIFRWLPSEEEDNATRFELWSKLVAGGVVKNQPEDEIHIRATLEMPSVEEDREEEGETPSVEDEETSSTEEMAEQPRASKGSPIGGQWVSKGGGGLSTTPPKVQVRLTRTSKVAFDGAQREPGEKLSKLETGELGEAIAVEFLKSQGHADAGLLNGEFNNFPVDLVHDHEVLEVKTGLASNSRSAHQWRATIGQPGPKESAWLKSVSPEEKSAWNARKSEMILERKQAVVSSFSDAAGRKVKGKTLGVILDTKSKVADVYVLDGFHSRVGWNSDTARNGYVGSYQYAVGA